MRNAKLTSAGTTRNLDIFIKDGLINNLLPAGENSDLPRNWPVYDLKGKYVFPGIFDSHIHGSNGVDLNHIDNEKLDHFSCYLAKHGVTAFFASIVSDSDEKLYKLLQFYAQAAERDLPGARLAGIHLEGPWISPRRSGAISAANLKRPQLELLKRYQAAAQGWIKYITVAPELEGAFELIEKSPCYGISVGLGHTEASYELGCEAIAKGAKLATHLGNAMTRIHQRRPGIIGAILESDLPVELIFDGIHIHPANLRLISKIVSFDRIIGVSDATMARGLADGDYVLGTMEFTLENGVSRLKGSNTLAGSTLDPIQAIKNAAEILDVDIKEVYPFFSLNPARLYSQNTGEIAEGCLADLLVFSENFELSETWVAGRHVFSAVL